MASHSNMGGPARNTVKPLCPLPKNLELTSDKKRQDHTLMNATSSNPTTTRREFIKTTGRIAAASALAGVALPSVHAAGSDLVQVALIGCGGRGTGAADDALASHGGPTKLVAMADVFHDKLNTSFESLKSNCG